MKKELVKGDINSISKRYRNSNNNIIYYFIKKNLFTFYQIAFTSTFINSL